MLHLPFIFLVLFYNVLAQNPKVVTTTGEVEGAMALTVLKNLLFYKFLGIPYGEPPIGSLRFKEPVAKIPWTGTLNATQDGSQCVQGYYPYEYSGSEDCLYLNAYTSNLSGNAPMLVWIHGGGFIYGSGSYEYFPPDYFIDKGVCFFIMNYRVDFFGFSSTADSEAYGNNGLKDVLLALQWIIDNGEAFGCDTSKITLGGQSSGGVITSLFTQSPVTRDLFHNAIMMSGTGACPWTRSEDARKYAFEVGENALVFAKNDSKVLMDQLRNKSTADVYSAARIVYFKHALPDNVYSLFPIGPVIEVPNARAILTDYFIESIKSGNFKPMPCFIGHTSLEFAFNFYISNQVTFDVTAVQYQVAKNMLVPPSMNLVDGTEKSQVGSEIDDYYFKNQTPEQFNYNFIKFASDTMFVRPTMDTGRIVSTSEPTYFYYFDHQGPWGTNSNTTHPGSAHGDDLAYIFALNRSFEINAADAFIRNGLTKLVSNFVFYGKPTLEADPELNNLNWTVVDPNNIQVLLIRDNFSMGATPAKVDMEFWDAEFSNHAKPPEDMY